MKSCAYFLAAGRSDVSEIKKERNIAYMRARARFAIKARREGFQIEFDGNRIRRVTMGQRERQSIRLLGAGDGRRWNDTVDFLADY